MITGTSIPMLKKLRAGKIPNHIVLVDGKYQPSRDVLIREIAGKYNKYVEDRNKKEAL